MLPLHPTTQTFSADQRIAFRARTWDTTTTPSWTRGTEEVSPLGIGYVAADLWAARFAPKTRSELEAALRRGATNELGEPLSRAMLGYEASGAARSGVVPLVYQYWGSGAPTGLTQARHLLLKYFGTVEAAVQGTLVLGGQGSVHVCVNGATVLAGPLREPRPDPNVHGAHPAQFYTDLTREAGYQIAELSLQAGDTLEIYYWHFGEPWGGVFAKLLPGAGYTEWNAFQRALEDAPLLGSSLFHVGTRAAQNVAYLESARLSVRRHAAPVLELTVPLAEKAEGQGWRFAEDADALPYLIDNQNATRTLRRHRRLAFEAGFLAGGAEELYPRFTGRIEDIHLDKERGVAVLTCHGFESRLQAAFDENHPSRLAHLAAGYVHREWRGHPVYAIPAYDTWPLEVAVADLCAQAGVDPLNLGKSPHHANAGLRTFRDSLGALHRTSPRFAARRLSNTGEKLYLQRNGAYGNVGVRRKDYLPPDDPYLYGADVARKLYDRALDLAGVYGIEFLFDAEGQATLRMTNNPAAFHYASTPGAADEVLTPAAVGGRYRLKKSTDAAWSWVHEGEFSRLDLYVGYGRDLASGENGGVLRVEAERWDGTAWQPVEGYPRTISTFVPIQESHYYDDHVRTDGSNAAVHTLLQGPFDRYRVSITPGGRDLRDTGARWRYRLNGLATFDRDPLRTSYSAPITTLGNALKVTPESGGEELRNHVIVVGQRKALLTDSAKLSELQNPNNPEREFNLAVASDPGSIYDPESPNFVGSKQMTLLVDEKVNDTAFARWLARTLITRYRMPKSSARLEHTALPTLELGDALHVIEPAHRAVDHLLWTTAFTEQWESGRATVEVETTSYPETPSYTPREDLDLSLYSEEERRNLLYRNLRLRYGNLYGRTLTEAEITGERSFPEALSAALPATEGSTTLPAGALPETVHLAHETRPPLVNHPYRHFWNTRWNDTTPTLHWDFQEGDGAAGVYDPAFHAFPGTWEVRFRRLGTREGANLFYDPYTSERGNLIQVQFDTFVSGFYRVSLWAAPLKAGDIDTPVAWLTNPSADPLSEDAHLVYLEAGAKHTAYWDGVDAIGQWNQRQSQQYAALTQGAFGEEGPVGVGASYYVWEDQTTSPLTQIGDVRPENYGSGETAGHYYGVGRYARFYVMVEIVSDHLMRQTGESTPLEFNTHQRTPPGGANPNGVDHPLYLYTHRGEPTQVALEVYDWNPDQGEWTRSTPGTHPGWTNAPLESATNAELAAATIRKGKPLKVRFRPVPRRGWWFREDADQVSVKLVRQAHLKTTTFDQFWTFYGHPWDNVHETNSPAKNPHNLEEKRLTSRMYHNDTHTVEWKDDAWRSSTDLAGFEWIFLPELFEKDFGGGYVEALRYGDYEQLEAIPGFETRRLGGTARADRSYLTMAYISYLYFLSAYSLDRSGRRQWCVNRAFVDRSKIVTPDWLAAEAGHADYAADYERAEADVHLVRTILCRQWIEPGWKTGALPLSPVSLWGVSSTSPFLQPKATDFDPYNSPFNTAGVRDQWLANYATTGTSVNVDLVGGNGSFTLPSVALRTNQLRPASFGSWPDMTARGIYTGLPAPSPARDFHPYWRFPLMPDVARENLDDYLRFDVLEFPASWVNDSRKLRDPAAQETYFGWSWLPGSRYGAGGEGARVERTVRDLANATYNLKERMAEVFDYAKQDDLDRFDPFRGVISRGGYSARDDRAATYWSKDRKRSASAQRVKPAGVYLTHLGRYADYTVGRVHSQVESEENVVHFTSNVTDWYDLRFRHEYLWYSPAYFPVLRRGAPAYYRLHQELTGVRDPYPGEQEMDAGAWTGWKDDVPASEWPASPYLRWFDVYGTLAATPQPKTRTGKQGEPAFLGGSTGGLTGTGGTYVWDFMADRFKSEGEGRRVQPWNLFDFTNTTTPRMRLAVGPRVPETRGIVMNLTLPKRLSGR